MKGEPDLENRIKVGTARDRHREHPGLNQPQRRGKAKWLYRFPTNGVKERVHIMPASPGDLGEMPLAPSPWSPRS